MELDELKKELNSKISHNIEPISHAQLTKMLKHDATAISQKIKKSLKIELLISVIFAALCMYMIFFGGYWIYKALFITLFVICLAIIPVLLVLIKKANALIYSGSVKQNLEKLVALLDEFIKRYLQLTLILIPVIFLFSIWLSYNNEETVLLPLRYDMILILFITLLASTGIIYFFTKWYLRKLYGNYLLQLKQMLTEFEEEK